MHGLTRTSRPYAERLRAMGVTTASQPAARTRDGEAFDRLVDRATREGIARERLTARRNEARAAGFRRLSRFARAVRTQRGVDLLDRPAMRLLRTGPRG